MIKIKRLSLENFRSFRAKQTVEFETGFYCLKGHSGVGKSNLLYGISYCLGFCPIPATSLQNVFCKEPMQAELVLDCNGKEIVIRRGKENKFICETEVIEGASAVNFKIKELFAGRFESVPLLVMRNQRTSGNFLSLSSSDQESFLSTVLGLNKLEDFIGFTSDSIKTVKDSLSVEEGSLLGLQKAKDSIQLEDIELLNNSISEKKMLLESNVVLFNEVSSDLEKAKKIFQEKQIKVDNDLKHLFEKESELKDQISSFSLKIKDLENQASTVRNKVHNFESTRESNKLKLRLLNKELVEVLSHIDKTEKNICFACNQSIPENNVQLSALLTKSVELKQGIEILTNKIAESNTLDLDLLESIKKQIQQNIDCKKQIEDQLKQLDLQKKQTKNEELEKDLQSIRDLELKLKNVSNKEAPLRASIIGLEFSIKTAEKQKSAVDNIKEEILQKVFKIDTLKQRIENLSLVNSINKEFLTKIFEETLLEIGSKVNDGLTLIPNVKNVSFAFSTSKMAKNGNVKNVININVFKNGVEMPAKAGISGGQLSSVELLVDAAVHEVVTRRTGLDLGWLILDEPFEGLHPVDKEACLQILKTLYPEKTVLIIDHSTETKENFDYFIEIVNNENGFSEIK